MWVYFLCSATMVSLVPKPGNASPHHLKLPEKFYGEYREMNELQRVLVCGSEWKLFYREYK